MVWPRLLLTLVLSLSITVYLYAQPASVETSDVNGYRGIWFTLGQVSEYGDKYSGGLGTYTAKHRPLLSGFSAIFITVGIKRQQPRRDLATG